MTKPSLGSVCGAAIGGCFCRVWTCCQKACCVTGIQLTGCAFPCKQVLQTAAGRGIPSEQRQSGRAPKLLQEVRPRTEPQVQEAHGGGAPAGGSAAAHQVLPRVQADPAARRVPSGSQQQRRAASHVQKVQRRLLCQAACSDYCG